MGQLGPKWAKMRFQAIFLFDMRQFLLVVHILIENNYIQYLMAVRVLNKNLLAQKWANQGQKWAKMRFQAIFLFDMRQFLLVVHIMIENNYIQYLMAVQVLNKNLLAQKWANQGQKWAKMRFYAIFLFNTEQFLLALHMTIESYCIQQLMMVEVLNKNSLALEWAIWGSIQALGNSIRVNWLVIVAGHGILSLNLIVELLFHCLNTGPLGPI